MVDMELAGMWERAAVRAMPWVVVHCWSRTSRTTASRQESTALAGGKQERRTFILHHDWQTSFMLLHVQLGGFFDYEDWNIWTPRPENINVHQQDARVRHLRSIHRPKFEVGLLQWESCKCAAAQVFVTVVTSFPVSRRAAPTCPFMVTEAVGH